MALYLIGLGIFFGTHLFTAVRSRAPGRDLRQNLGEGPYMGLYSLLALGGFILLVYGYGQADAMTQLYAAPVWGRHLNYLLIPVAMVILVAAYVPTGHIKKSLKHPMLVAVKLWAFGHLLANGELRSVLLFGAFLAYGVIARIAAKRRGDEGPGPDVVPNAMGDLLAVVIGLALSAALIFGLHGILFGRYLWPMA